jgi:ComF family protein
VVWISAAAQCVLDFLVDERCHSCGWRVGAGTPAPPRHPLARPVSVVCLGAIRVSTRVLCEDCAGAIRPWREPVALGRIAADTVAGGAPASNSHEAPRALADDKLVAYAAFETDERLLGLIHLLKFRRRESLAVWLARAMAECLPRRVADAAHGPVVLVPVPLDRAAFARRGFNQAGRMAEELGRCWGMPVASRALVKPHPTPPQSSLGRDERARNVRDAFAPGGESVLGRHAVVVDDLVTTGATAAACARALVSAGASSVRVVCAGYRP